MVAQRSPYAVTGLAKLGLEIFTFGIGITESFLLYEKWLGGCTQLWPLLI
ncbi:hypothetical protein ACVRWB_01450 [Streptococcus troglodytae]